MNLNKPRNVILVGVVSSVAASLLITGIGYLISPLFNDQILASFIAAAIGLLILFASIYFRVINIFEFIGTRYLGRRTGIIKIYNSFHDAFGDIRDCFATSRQISLLLYIGRREFGEDESLFLDLLEKRIKQKDNFELRILHSSPNSPHLSQQKANRLGRRKEKWISQIEKVRENIIKASAKSDNVRVFSHKEPYIWRMLIFDDIMFVSGYIQDTKNDKKAPVFCIKDGKDSLHTVFYKYYNHLWAIYSSGEHNTD